MSRHLRVVHGHETVELERYAMANKIWATKIKRLRLVDLVCLRCGLRVEARAKSDLKVRMSHSNTDGRQWDAGMRDEDLCALVPWADGAVAGEPQYFEVGAMREAAPYATLGTPKAPSEGAERDMTWPARVATRDGVVEAIDWDEAKVRVRPIEGNRQTVALRGDDVPTYIYVDEGDELRGGVTFILGCLDRPATLECPGETWDYVSDLGAENGIDRYVAVKAAGLRGGDDLEELLREIASDEDEDDRIRLEAWASLARLDPVTYTPTIVARAEERTGGDRQAMSMAMEAIFILSELGTPEAGEALSRLADDRELDSEARCACVWGLGTAGLNEPERVLPFIADDDEDVALHALAGIGSVSQELLPEVARRLTGTSREAASASTLLAMQGDDGIAMLVESAKSGGTGTAWATAALGELPEADVRRVTDGALTDDLELALVPMWTQRQSWLRGQELDTPLRFLQRQAIRHLA